MKHAFASTLQIHKILYHFLTNLSDHELFTIPKGFNNNIWWNIAHVVVTQQKLVYGLSGLPLNLSQELVDKYQKGTRPEENPTKDEMEEVKKLLFTTLEQTEKDYQLGLFKEYKSYMTTPKISLDSVEDAIGFNIFHEGLHLGQIMSYQRILKG